MRAQAQIATKPDRTAEPSRSFAPSRVLRRKCSCGANGRAGGTCAECAKKRKLQRRTRGSDTGFEVPPSVYATLRSPGQPLDEATRTSMEATLGHDFSRVRIHTDAPAGDSARAVDALAYTVGHSIVFGTGQYAPDTEAGRHLLAHELAHTIQQGAAAGPVETAELTVGHPAEPAEAEADAFATRAAQPSGAISGDAPMTLTRTNLAVARTLCSNLSYRSCTTGVYKCGYGGSGTCGWVGPSRGGCICVGAKQPPLSRVIEVLLIIGLSITLAVSVIAALLDPEPASKLALIGLSAAQVSLLLVLLGYKEEGEDETTASVDSSATSGTDGTRAA